MHITDIVKCCSTVSCCCGSFCQKFAKQNGRPSLTLYGTRSTDSLGVCVRENYLVRDSMQKRMAFIRGQSYPPNTLGSRHIQRGMTNATINRHAAKIPAIIRSQYCFHRVRRIAAAKATPRTKNIIPAIPNPILNLTADSAKDAGVPRIAKSKPTIQRLGA